MDFLDEIRFVGADEESTLGWPDVYFRGDYGRLYCGPDAEWRCVLWRSSVALPLIVRHVPESLTTDKILPLLDAVTPYGYTGAVALRGAPAPDWDAFWKCVAVFLARHRVVCVFLRCCPYFPMQLEAALAAGIVFLERTTYSIDMTDIDSVKMFVKRSRKVPRLSLSLSLSLSLCTDM
jgi:hypothetical protein